MKRPSVGPIAAGGGGGTPTTVVVTRLPYRPALSAVGRTLSTTLPSAFSSAATISWLLGTTPLSSNGIGPNNLSRTFANTEYGAVTTEISEDGIVARSQPYVLAPGWSDLSLATSSVAQNAVAGTVVGAIQNKLSGATLSLPVSDGGRFQIDALDRLIVTSTGLVAGARGVTIRQTIGSHNYDTVLTVTVVNVQSISAGTVPALNLTQGVALQPLDLAAAFTVAGGSATYALAPGSNPLPAGLTLNSAGQLSGTPTVVAGATNFVVRGTLGGLTADLTVDVTVVAPADTAPPQVSAASPVAGSTDQSLSGSRTFTFTEAVTEGTHFYVAATDVLTGAILTEWDSNIVPSQRGTGLGQYTVSGTQVTVRYPADLPEGAQVRFFVLRHSVKDGANNPMAADYQDSFTTLSINRPVIINTTPSEGSVPSASAVSQIVLTVDETVTEGSYFYAGVWVGSGYTTKFYEWKSDDLIPRGLSAGQYLISGSTVTLSLPSPLADADNVYVFLFKGSLQNDLGREMAADFELYFNTAVPVSQGGSATIVDGAVTYTLASAPIATGTAKCGSKYAVVPNAGSIVLNSVSPAHGTEAGTTRDINGIAKNPIEGRKSNGIGAATTPWDGLGAAYASSAVLGLPATLTSPSVVVKAVSRPGMTSSNRRQGLVDQWSVLHVTPNQPTANQIAPTPFGWPNRTQFVWRDFDPNLVLNMLKTRVGNGLSIAGMPSVSFRDAMLAKIDAINLGALASRATVESGYEAHSLNLWPMSVSGGAYGANANTAFDYLICLLISNALTQQQKEMIVTRLGVYGSWMFDTCEGMGTPFAPDGGHTMWQHIAGVFGLIATGRISRLKDLPQIMLGNAFGQYFRFDAAKVADCVPHNDTARPYSYRLRGVMAVSPTTISVARTSSDAFHMTFVGLEARKADGTLIGTVTAVSGTNDNPQVLTIAGGVTGVSVGDQVYFKPARAHQVGDVDWCVGGVWSSYNAAPGATYRALNFPAGTAMLVRALGIYDQITWGTLEDYAVLAASQTFPSSAYPWSSPFGNTTSTAIKNFVQAFWNAHWATLLGATPITDTTGPVLTLPIDTANGSVGVNWGVTTDSDGPLYIAVHDAATSPTQQEIETGVGGGIIGSGVVSVSTAGAKSGAIAYSTPGTYKVSFFQRDAFGNPSNIVRGDGFTIVAATGPLTTLAVSEPWRDRQVYPVRGSIGLTTARVPVTVTGSVGGTVQARLVDVEFAGAGTTNWATLGVMPQSGTLTANLLLSRSLFWGKIEVRFLEATNVGAVATKRIAAGDVVMFMGQSELANPFTSTYGNLSLYPSLQVAKPDNVWIATGPTAAGAVNTLVNNTTKGTLTHVDLANAYNQLFPNGKAQIVLIAAAGTGPDEMLDDTNAGRLWSNDDAVFRLATDNLLVLPSAVLIHWVVNPANYGVNYGNAFAEMLTGKRPDGSDVVPGTNQTYPNGKVYSRLDHTLKEWFGAWAETKVTMVTVAGDSYNTYASVLRPAWIKSKVKNPLLNAIADLSVHKEIIGHNRYRPGFSTGGDTSHPGIATSSNRDGAQRFAIALMELALETNASITRKYPVLDSSYFEPSGAYVEFYSAGNPINTIWGARGLTPPSTARPVIGIMINGVSAQNTSIVAGRIRVLPPTGQAAFTGADVFAFDTSTRMAVRDTTTQDKVDEFWMGQPIVADPTGTVLEGVPLNIWNAPYSIWANPLPVARNLIKNTTSGTGLTRSNVLDAEWDHLVFTSVFDSTGTGQTRLVAELGTAGNCPIIHVLDASNQLRVQVRNGSGTLIYEALYAMGTRTNEMRWIVAIDAQARRVVVVKDGVVLTAASVTVPWTAAAVSITAGRGVRFFRNSSGSQVLAATKLGQLMAYTGMNPLLRLGTPNEAADIAALDAKLLNGGIVSAYDTIAQVVQGDAKTVANWNSGQLGGTIKTGWSVVNGPFEAA